MTTWGVNALCVLLMLELLLTVPAVGLGEDHWSKVRITVPDQETMVELMRMGVEFEGATGKPGGSMECVVHSNVLKRLRSHGIAVETVIEDLETFYAARLAPGPVNALGFGYGTMGGYYTLDEIRQQLDSLRTLHPEVVGAPSSIGNSLQGRPIWALRMTADPDLPSDRPQVLYFAMQHAREPMGMMTLLYFMWRMAEGYGIDPEITYLLESRDLWFIPIVNVDGYEANRRVNPTGGGLRRKNMRNVQADGDLNGVDLARNWDSNWGRDNIGSSPNLLDLTYRGTAAFSEPETQVLRDFCSGRAFRLVLEYHSYGNAWFCPPGYVMAETPDSLIFRAYLREMTRENHYLYGTSSCLYLLNGFSVDWAYEHPTVQGPVYSFAAEVGAVADGFWPASTRILPLAAANLRTNLFGAWAAGACPKVQGCTISDSGGDGDIEAGEPFTASIRLYNFGVEAASQVRVSATSATPFLELTTGEAVIGNLESHADTTLVLSGRVAENAPGGTEGKLLVSVSPVAQLQLWDTVTVVTGKSELLFADNAEAGIGNWLAAGDWGLTNDAHSGQWSFTDSPQGNYRLSSQTSLTLASPVAIPLTSGSVRLQFWTRWSTEAIFDVGQVRYSVDRGAMWIPLRGRHTSFGDADGYSGWEPSWVQEDIDLTFLRGKEVSLQFLFRSDDSAVKDGWYIDDIAVRSYRMTGSRLGSTPAIQFPPVAVGEADTSILPLWNLGTAPLTVSSLSLGSAGFSAIPPEALPFTIAGTLDSVAVPVVFQPSSHGKAEDTLRIATDDLIDPVVNVPLSGFGVLLGETSVGTIYASSTVPTSSLYTLDPATAETTGIGPLGIREIVSLAVHPATGELYGIAPATGVLNLYRLSCIHGQTVPGAAIPLTGAVAMALSPQGDLFVGTGTGRLYRVALPSGDTTFVGEAAGVKYAALAFQPVTGELWAADQAGTKDGILTVNTETGDTTLVGRTGDRQLTISLAFDASGTLLGLKGSPFQKNRLIQIDLATGSGTLIDTTSVVGIRAIAVRSVITGFGEPIVVAPLVYRLEQNYPNPFNPSTVIRYTIVERQRTTLEVFDVLGRKVATLVNDVQEPGSHTVSWNPSGVSSGVYFYRLTAGEYVQTRKLVLMR